MPLQPWQLGSDDLLWLPSFPDSVVRKTEAVNAVVATGVAASPPSIVTLRTPVIPEPYRTTDTRFTNFNELAVFPAALPWLSHQLDARGPPRTGADQFVIGPEEIEEPLPWLPSYPNSIPATRTGADQFVIGPEEIEEPLPWLPFYPDRSYTRLGVDRVALAPETVEEEPLPWLPTYSDRSYTRRSGDYFTIAPEEVSPPGWLPTCLEVVPHPSRVGSTLFTTGPETIEQEPLPWLPSYPDHAFIFHTRISSTIGFLSETINTAWLPSTPESLPVREESTETVGFFTEPLFLTWLPVLPESLPVLAESTDVTGFFTEPLFLTWLPVLPEQQPIYGGPTVVSGVKYYSYTPPPVYHQLVFSDSATFSFIWELITLVTPLPAPSPPTPPTPSPSPLQKIRRRRVRVKTNISFMLPGIGSGALPAAALRPATIDWYLQEHFKGRKKRKVTINVNVTNVFQNIQQNIYSDGRTSETLLSSNEEQRKALPSAEWTKIRSDTYPIETGEAHVEVLQNNLYRRFNTRRVVEAQPLQQTYPVWIPVLQPLAAPLAPEPALEPFWVAVLGAAAVVGAVILLNVLTTPKLLPEKDLTDEW